MANSADKKTLIYNERSLTCEVCTERYEKPKILPCGHTYCQDCLENWAKKNSEPEKNPTCPKCRQSWQVPTGGFDQLLTNYTLLDVIDSLEISEETKKTNHAGDSKICGFCKGNEACLECSKSAYGISVNRHLTAGHTIASSLNNEPSKNCECGKHPEFSVSLENLSNPLDNPISLQEASGESRNFRKETDWARAKNVPLKTVKMIKIPGGELGQINRLTGVTVSSAKEIYVANQTNHRIQVFDSRGEYKRQFALTSSGKDVELFGVAFTREDHLVITDTHGRQVCVCDTGGKLLRRFGQGELKHPYGVAVSSDGHIHVADFGGDCVKTFTADRRLVRTIGERGSQPGQFNSAYGVSVNSKDQIIVSDNWNHRVQVFDSSGAFLFAFGKWGGGEDKLEDPRGVTVDQEDNFIVYFRENDRLVMFGPEGNYIGRIDDPSNGIKSVLALATVSDHSLKVILTENKNQLRILCQSSKI